MDVTVILSDSASPSPAGTARFGRELTRALIETAPAGSTVSGYTHRLRPDEDSALRADLTGLAAVHESRLSRRMLARLWASPAADPRLAGTVLAPSLFAPLRAQRQSRGAAELLVTIHDLVPFTHPETLTPRGVRWHRSQIRAAQRWADAIIVPSEAVAAELASLAPAGNRVHVIPPAASPVFRAAPAPDFAPDRPTIVFLGTIEPRKGLDLLIEAMATPRLAEGDVRELQLVIVGAPGWGSLRPSAHAHRHGLAADRIAVLGRIDDSQLAEVISSASALVLPSTAEGFGLPLVEAMALGTPVIHSLDPALVETAGGAGRGVDVSGVRSAAVERLAEAIAEVTLDAALRTQMRERGLRRATDFSWESSATRVWTLVES